jgi:hypothetical protein
VPSSRRRNQELAPRLKTLVEFAEIKIFGTKPTH